MPSTTPAWPQLRSTVEKKMRLLLRKHEQEAQSDDASPSEKITAKVVRKKLEKALKLPTGTLKNHKDELTMMLAQMRGEQAAGATQQIVEAASLAAPASTELPAVVSAASRDAKNVVAVRPAKKPAKGKMLPPPVPTQLSKKQEPVGWERLTTKRRRALFCNACGSLLSTPSVTGTTISCKLCGVPVSCRSFENLVVVSRGEEHHVLPARDAGWKALPSVLHILCAVTVSHTSMPAALLSDMGGREQKARARATVQEACPQCKHPELQYYTMQLRSADEGQTVFYECEKCGHTYSTNT